MPNQVSKLGEADAVILINLQKFLKMAFLEIPLYTIYTSLSSTFSTTSSKSSAVSTGFP